MPPTPAGSDAWTPHERRQFAKAFAQHGKDFALIQRAVRHPHSRPLCSPWCSQSGGASRVLTPHLHLQVPSKRLQQCVEFYYLRKSRLGRGQKRQGPSEVMGGVLELRRGLGGCKMVLAPHLPLLQALDMAPGTCFPCQRCGR